MVDCLIRRHSVRGVVGLALGASLLLGEFTPSAALAVQSLPAARAGQDPGAPRQLEPLDIASVEEAHPAKPGEDLLLDEYFVHVPTRLGRRRADLRLRALA